MKKKRKHQPRCRSIQDFKSILRRINFSSYYYFDEKGLVRYENELRESVMQMIQSGQHPNGEIIERMRLIKPRKLV